MNELVPFIPVLIDEKDRCPGFPFDLTPMRGSGIRSYSDACYRAIDGCPGEVLSGLKTTVALFGLYPRRTFVARLATPREIAVCGNASWRGALVVGARMRPGDDVVWGDGSVCISCDHFVQVLIPWGYESRDCYDHRTRVRPLQYEHSAREAFLFALSVLDVAGASLACSPPIAVTPTGFRKAWVS